MRRIVSTAVMFATTFGVAFAGLNAGAGNLPAAAQQKADATEVKIDNFSFGPAELKVPVGTKARVEQLLDHIPTYKFPQLPARTQLVTAGPSRWYKVRMGDTLGKVSKRFHIPIKTLKTKNSLSGPTIRPGDFLVISR